MSRRRVPPSIKEQEFFSALASYRETGKKCYRDVVFYRVQEVCYAVAKRILGDVRVQDFSGKVLDATCLVMNRLDRNGEKDTPKKLSTFVYCYVRRALTTPQMVCEERQTRLPEFSENCVSAEDVADLDILGECDEFTCEDNGKETD